MASDFQLDVAGVREILQSDGLRAVVDGLADEVATTVRASLPPGTVVEVRRYTTDRGAASVVIADVRGMAWQARDGVLTRAAGAAGLEVRAWQR